jgi:hypothetical protein
VERPAGSLVLVAVFAFDGTNDVAQWARLTGGAPLSETNAAMLDAILKLLERVERRIDENEQNASVSRGRIHERMDEQAAAISEIRKDVEISAMVVAQQRDVITELDGKITKVQPDIEQWRQVRRLGYGFSAVLVAVGMTGAGLLIYLGETARVIVRKWLGIL